MPNLQNDRVWARNSDNVEPCVRVRFPGKIHVWGIMSYRAVSDLHIVPPKQTINDCYFRDYILIKTCKDDIERNSENGTILQRSMLSDMSRFIFMQDGVPAHTANLTQSWCEKNFQKFWKKEWWPGNSPDLNPIENLWSNLKDSVSQMENVTKLDDIISQVQKAWMAIDPKFLENLVTSMPNRIKSVILCHGDYINKYFAELIHASVFCNIFYNPTAHDIPCILHVACMPKENYEIHYFICYPIITQL